jgi:hypothetical protein
LITREGYGFTFPCSEGAIDVVETADTALDAKVLGVVLAQLLSCKLLQAIGILRLEGNRSKKWSDMSHLIDSKENDTLFQMNSPQQARHQIPSGSHLSQAA